MRSIKNESFQSIQVKVVEEPGEGPKRDEKMSMNHIWRDEGKKTKCDLLIMEFVFTLLGKQNIPTLPLYLYYIILCSWIFLLMGNIKMSTIVSIKGL